MYRARGYGPVEASRILRDAAELQARDPKREPARSLSESELRARAEDLGIAPRFVDQIVNTSVRPADIVEPSAWTGRPHRIAYERVIDGEIRRASHPGLVAALRRRIGDTGHTEVIGSSLTWRPTPQSRRQLSVSIVPDQGKTTLFVEERFDHLAGQIFGGFGGGLGGGGLGLVVPLVILATRSPMMVVAVVFSYLFGVYSLVRGYYHRSVDKRIAEVDKLTLALEEAITRSAMRAGRTRITPEGAEQPASESDEDEEEEAFEEQEAQDLSRARRAVRESPR